MVSLEKKKLLQLHLDNARKHAETACRFEHAPLAARSIRDAISELATAVELLQKALDRQEEIF